MNKTFVVLGVVAAVSILGFKVSDRCMTYVTQVPVTFLMADQPEWRRIEHEILTTNSKNIVIKWAGYGGIVTVAAEFIDTIVDAEKQGKTITAEVTAESDSMHALALCFFDHVIIKTGAYLRFHDIYYVDPNGQKNYTKSIGDQSEADWLFDTCVNKGWLSETQKNDIYTLHKAVFVTSKDGKYTSTVGDDI